MKDNRILLLLGILPPLFSLPACSEYTPVFDGPLPKTTQDTAPTASFRPAIFLAATTGEAYALDSLMIRYIQLTNITGKGERVSTNIRHTRIATKTATGNIVISDAASNKISEVPASGTASFFDFFSNDSTLCCLQAETVKQFGSTVVPVYRTDLSTLFSGTGYSIREVKGLHVAATGEVFTTIRYKKGSTATVAELVYIDKYGANTLELAATGITDIRADNGGLTIAAMIQGTSGNKASVHFNSKYLSSFNPPLYGNNNTNCEALFSLPKNS